MITVVNCHYQTPDIYCGRPHKCFAGSPLANPFPMTSEADRSRVIAEYRLWLWGKIKAGDRAVLNELRIIVDLEQSRGSVALGCWCSPKVCHCDQVALALRSERVIGILNELMPF